MSNTYTWKISSLDCIPDVDGKTNYVVTSHWTCSGTDGSDHFGSVYSTVSFTVDPNKPNYKPFDSLTEEEVIEWTKSSLGEEQVNAVYSSIDTQIENQVNPPIITPPLPWAPTPSAE